MRLGWLVIHITNPRPTVATHPATADNGSDLIHVFRRVLFIAPSHKIQIPDLVGYFPEPVVHS